ncbi:MAG: hypothetical protein H7A33_06720 [Deltaproteobacteria bacterium]|nr:hypothetical protein [Deltaproteobacteria bacterium]
MFKKFTTRSTEKKEDFKPLKEGHVGMYACGVTVYDYCHLGHAFAHHIRFSSPRSSICWRCDCS